MLNVSLIKKSYSGKLVLDGVSFVANNSDKIAIVGLNGAGKSTLLNIITGSLLPDEGEIAGAGKIGFMPQTIDQIDMSENITVWEFLLSGRPIKELENKLNEAYIESDLNLAQELEEQLQEFEPYTAEADLNKIIIGLGIPSEWLDKRLSNLSGGQKSKVSFARVLYSISTLLLLDEPTNHLDEETKEWAMNYISRLDKPVIFISHDEGFLNKCANKILFLDSVTRKARLYNSGYQHFLRQQEDIAVQLEKQIKNQQDQIKKLESFILNADNARKRQAISREKTLGKIKENEIKLPPPPRKIRMNLRPKDIERGTPVNALNLYFGYDKDRMILRNTSFNLSTGERFLVVGQNGAGKSTLLKLLAGVTKPDSGEVELGHKTSVAYYAQEHENLNLDNTPMEEIQNLALDWKEPAIKGLLAQFNFDKTAISRKIKTLSPGERSRLAMAKLCLSGANLLILDEPTNHLDVVTKKYIAQVMNQYGGTMIIVSHDTEFLEHFDITRMLVMPECKIKFYNPETVKKLGEMG